MDKKNQYQKCPQINNRYINPGASDIRRNYLDILFWKSGGYRDPLHSYAPPSDFCRPKALLPFDPKKPSAVWINHSTFLISVFGVSILTDPIWSRHCFALPVGPRRKHPPALGMDKLPFIDYVLISHNHYDHLDWTTVKKLALCFPEIKWIVPKGIKKWFRKRGIESVYELQWWDKLIFSPEDGVTVHINAVPAQHFSGRSLFDTDKTLWAGFVVDVQSGEGKNKRLYFAGDTGYNATDFKMIGNCFGGMDLSLLPIGTYYPRRFMKPVHMHPKEAVQIHKEVQSRFSLGMHWKTFCLSDEPAERPPYDLYLALKNAELPSNEFIAPDPGEYVNW